MPSMALNVTGLKPLNKNRGLNSLQPARASSHQRRWLFCSFTNLRLRFSSMDLSPFLPLQERIFRSHARSRLTCWASASKMQSRPSSHPIFEGIPLNSRHWGNPTSRKKRETWGTRRLGPTRQVAISLIRSRCNSPFDKLSR